MGREGIQAMVCCNRFGRMKGGKKMERRGQGNLRQRPNICLSSKVMLSERKKNWNPHGGIGGKVICKLRKSKRKTNKQRRGRVPRDCVLMEYSQIHQRERTVSFWGRTPQKGWGSSSRSEGGGQWRGIARRKDEKGAKRAEPKAQGGR